MMMMMVVVVVVVGVTHWKYLTTALVLKFYFVKMPEPFPNSVFIVS
jgi:hypothetical protein